MKKGKQIIKNAIIIHGPGRSGTTLLNNMLSLHPDLAWVSSWVNKYPAFQFLSVLNRWQGISIIERLTRNRRYFPRPTEPYHFFNYYFPEFNDEVVNIESSNSSDVVKAINNILAWQGKKRFITKITGQARSASLELVFENPYVIWIDRAPKSVIMSYYKQRWGYKNKPELFSSIPTSDLLDEYASKYYRFQESKESLKAFQFKEIRYEDLIKNKQEVFKELCAFCHLEFTSAFQKIVESWEFKKGTNDFYKKYLTQEDEIYLDTLIRKH